MKNSKTLTKFSDGVSRLKKSVSRKPEVQSETEIISEAKLAGKHRRNIVITLIIPVLFFGAISLGLDRPQKAKEVPCQGVTSQFTLTEQPVVIPAGTSRAIKGPEDYSMMRTYSVAGQALDTIPLGYTTTVKPSSDLRAIPLTDIVKLADDADLEAQLRQVRNLAYAIRYNGEIASAILSMTAREGTIATWIAAQRILGVDADFFYNEPSVSELADSIA